MCETNVNQIATISRDKVCEIHIDHARNTCGPYRDQIMTNASDKACLSGRVITDFKKVCCIHIIAKLGPLFLLLLSTS